MKKLQEAASFDEARFRKNVRIQQENIRRSHVKSKLDSGGYSTASRESIKRQRSMQRRRLQRLTRSFDGKERAWKNIRSPEWVKKITVKYDDVFGEGNV